MDEPSLPRDIEDEVRVLVLADEERLGLTDLLGELRAARVAPDELTAHRHLRAMRALAAETVETRVDRSARGRPSKLRVVAASWITATAVVGCAGLAAASGALPGPRQHAG